jgi:hypothetical protein
MPLALSRKFTTWVSLPLEMDIPEAERPAFEVLFISEQQARALEKAVDAEKLTYAEYAVKLAEIIAPVVVGVRNINVSGMVGADVAPAERMELLRGLLHEGEIRDLALAILTGTRLGYEELKKSRLAPASAPA